MQNGYCLVQCEEQRLDRESYCAVKLLLDMCGVPTLFKNP